MCIITTFSKSEKVDRLKFGQISLLLMILCLGKFLLVKDANGRDKKLYSNDNKNGRIVVKSGIRRHWLVISS